MCRAQGAVFADGEEDEAGMVGAWEPVHAVPWGSSTTAAALHPKTPVFCTWRPGLLEVPCLSFFVMSLYSGFPVQAVRSRGQALSVSFSDLSPRPQTVPGTQ